MTWDGRWEGGSGLGTHAHPWQIHVNVWQNQYIIVKQNKVKIKIKKKKVNGKMPLEAVAHTIFGTMVVEWSETLLLPPHYTYPTC